MRRRIMLLLGLTMLIGAAAGPAGAITGEHPDGTAHPYVGFVGEPEGGFCSSTLLSPTVFLTAGHRLGPGGVICGRLTSLNHRLDTAVALDWINSFL